MTEKIVDRLNREQVVRLVLDQMREADHWTVAQAVLDALERWDGLPPDDIGARRAFLTELHPNGSDTTVVTRAEQRPWTPERVRGLGMTTDLETAAENLGDRQDARLRVGQERRVPSWAAAPGAASRDLHP